MVLAQLRGISKRYSETSHCTHLSVKTTSLQRPLFGQVFNIYFIFKLDHSIILIMRLIYLALKALKAAFISRVYCSCL